MVNHSHSNLNTSNMLVPILTLISLVSSSYGGHGSHGYSSNGEDCVDVSRYGRVEYTNKTEQVCSYKVERTCIPKSEKVCVQVPKTTCTIKPRADCQNDPIKHDVQCDRTLEKNFLVKKCVPDGYKTLHETKKVPKCTNVTKNVCDSMWEVDESGKKVFVDNVNCREKSWQSCELVDLVVTENVPIKKCVDDEAFKYQVPVFETMEVTSYRRSCVGAGATSCQVTHEEQCTEVQWSDCQDNIVPSCNTVTTKIPFQEYLHLKRCAIKL